MFVRQNLIAAMRLQGRESEAVILATTNFDRGSAIALFQAYEGYRA